jgi:hypothetical protein
VSDILELFDAVDAAPREPNPCRRLYGPGPADKTCSSCALLAGHGNERTYWKCTLRELTAGAGSDHKRRWQACGRYAEQEPACSACGAEEGVRFSWRSGRAFCLTCWRREIGK